MFTLPAAILMFCVISIVITFAAVRRRLAAKSDLGAVSDQWIAENRLGHPGDGLR